MTDRSTWIAEKRQLDRLSTPEGRAQDCLEHTLPQSVVADAQKREMWKVMPDDLFILSADGGKLALWRATK